MVDITNKYARELDISNPMGIPAYDFIVNTYSGTNIASTTYKRGNQPLFDGASDIGRNTFGSTLDPNSALAQTYDTIMNTYKRGGSSGTSVAVVSYTYDGSDNLLTVTRSS